jgi:membrane protease YdiL (CAAX protease family)
MNNLLMIKKSRGFSMTIMLTLAILLFIVGSAAAQEKEVAPGRYLPPARSQEQGPTDPKTGMPSNRLYLWTIPLTVFVNVGYAVPGGLNEFWMKILPFLTPPSYTEIENLAEPGVGQWWLLGVLAVMIVFNHLIREELIFRGILLPKMNGVFGKRDVIANAILFATYRIHKMWVWPQILMFNRVLPWAAKRFKSYWVAIIIHGVFDALTLIILFTLAIMGLPQVGRPGLLPS